MTDRWVQIVRAAPDDGADWVVLPENGWGAVVAYHAGPGHVRPHVVPLSRRRVTETCTGADGIARRRTVQMSREDAASIVESVDSYLRDVGLPPAPFTWWEVAPPDGMSGDELLARLENACAGGVTATSGVEVARQYATVLAEELARIFGRSGGTA